MGLTGDWDGRISRRTLLRAGGSATAAYVLLGRGARSAQAVQTAFPFGIASGDPTPNGFVLWTRVTPAPPASVAEGLRYEIATDEGFKQIVRRGVTQAPQLESYSVHAEIAGPAAGHVVLVPLQLARGTSVGTGRTRTTPGAGLHPAAAVRLRVVPELHQRLLRRLRRPGRRRTSTSWCTWATTSTSGRVSARNGSATRAGPRALSLTDYRTRHAQYKRDRNLQAAHAAVPVPDDLGRPRVQGQLRGPRPRAGRAARDGARRGARRRTSPTGSTRRCARARKPVGKDMPLYRRAAWGDLATFHVLDTRQYRSNQIEACLSPSSCAGGLLPRRPARHPRHPGRGAA